LYISNASAAVPGGRFSNPPTTPSPTVGGKLIGNTLLTQTVGQIHSFSTKSLKMWKNKIRTFINSQEYSPIFAL
jgi:hypothetical protein